MLLVSFCMPTLVVAADLQVRVYERGGRAPLQGVAVCLGTPANIAQFGSELTDRKGNVVFSGIPGAQLVLTASKTGYRTEQQSLVTTNADRLLVISLPAGGGGPRCGIEGSDRVVAVSGMQVEQLKINKGAGVTSSRDVLLSHRVNREPTHYRASENPDFSDATWLAYTPGPAFELSPGNGRKVVYFQVRRSSGTSGADIQVVSPVVQDAIVLQQP
jgi:hypothetical protein